MIKYNLNEIDELNLTHFLNNSAQYLPDNPALRFVGGKAISYKDFKKQVDKIALSLQKDGVKQFDKIAIWSENSPNWLISYFAIINLGSIAIPILPDFSIKEVKNILEHAEVNTIFASSSFCKKIFNNLDVTTKTVIDLDNFTSHKYFEGNKIEKPLLSNINETDELIKPNINSDDLASIIYTSGTTGGSKGVMLSHKNFVANSIQAADTFSIIESDRFLSILPMSHVFEFTLTNILAVMCGSSVHYIGKPPTATVLMPALKEVKPTIFLTVPLIIEKLYKSKIYPTLTNSKIKRRLYNIKIIRKILHKIVGKKLMKSFGGEIKFFGIGGAKLDKRVEEFLFEADFPYGIGYGLTESSPLLAATIPHYCEVGSTGRVVNGSILKIINIDERTGEGEIVAYGPNVMKGYYKNDELNASVFTADGGLRTGDTGYFDKKGFLFIKGRIKNMILGPSGENIFPEEIEAEINKSQWVLESLVYELNGKIIARVFLNYEEIEKQFKEIKNKSNEIEKNIQELLFTLKKNVNDELNKFSKINNLFEQKEPFIKTPTKKIKRFLYHEIDVDENPKVDKE